ncbi:MAG: T9SS type A sorting domain-containing protein [Psychroflexus sp.]|nr:T9SS type A sorting domain-containing protein [Psychroflexus sp.]
MRVILIIFLFVQTSFAQVFDVETIKNSGVDENRINIVILSEGYQDSELNQFIIDATSFSNALFAETPYKEYENYFNVHAIKVPSNESGISHPGNAIDVNEPIIPIKSVDNYFEATFDHDLIHRVIDVNNTKVFNVLANNFPTYDIVLILINSPYRGGTAIGDLGAFTVHNSSWGVAIHEIGHAFAKLSDEYYSSGVNLTEGINMTQSSNPINVKWKNWLNQNGIGIYQHCCGGDSQNWYRPHQNCKMRFSNSPFCSVCIEGTIEKIHEVINPIESYSPTFISTIGFPSSITFNINSIDPIPNTLSIEWLINGNIVNDEDFSLVVVEDDLILGENQIQATVVDTTALVNVDNHASIHFNTVLWNLNTNTMGVQDALLNKLNLKLYPVPVQDILYFEFTERLNENYTTSIIDITGKKLVEKKFNNHSDQIPSIQFDNISAGVYFIKFRFDSGLRISKKIIKQ